MLPGVDHQVGESLITLEMTLAGVWLSRVAYLPHQHDSALCSFDILETFYNV